MRRVVCGLAVAGCLSLPATAQGGESQPQSAEALVEQLGDPTYRVRRAAQEQLRTLGDEAREALRAAAEEHEDAEVQWRAKRLLRQIEGGEEAREGLRERLEGQRPSVRWAFPQHDQDVGEAFEDLFERLETEFDVDVPRQRFFAAPFFQDLEQQMQDMRSRMRDLRFQSFAPGGSGNSFQMSIAPDGVEITVTEENEDGERETKTYEAPSLEEFREQYPDVAEQYLDGQGMARGFQLRFGQPGGGSGTRPQLQAPAQPMPGFQVLRPRAVPQVAAPAPAGPRLGVMVKAIGDDLRGYLGLDAEAGLLVESVVPGSLAESLALEPRDVVVEIEGESVGSPQQVSDALRAADETVDVVVIRKGERVSLQAPRPEEAKPAEGGVLKERAVIR